MQLFYASDLTSGTYELPEAEARHVVQVLRKREGAELNLVDGRGGWFRGEIVATGKKSCTLEVQEIKREAQRAPYRLTLAVAPTKSLDRYEWMLEKATEIGVDAIQPFISSHSERRNLRPDRLARVLEAAMKQSLQAWLPELLPLQTFAELIQEVETSGKMIAWIDESVNSHIEDNYQAGTDVTILIGPEGGFSPAEAATAQAAGFQAVALGPNRLRTETAGVVAAQVFAGLNWKP